MCGIAGIVDSKIGFDLEGAGRRMASALVHRGPDDEGIWIDASHGLVMVHRRLAILDVSPQGHQPMHSVGGRYVVVFNGEIYNFEEIRRELLATNYTPVWRGHSDTEVLLAAIEFWGFEATLKRLVGMFAIAIWDRSTDVAHRPATLPIRGARTHRPRPSRRRGIALRQWLRRHRQGHCRTGEAPWRGRYAR